MITKGIIVGVPSKNDNKYLVRIPIFESSANTGSASNNDYIKYEATVCNTPGVYYGLRTGDCVFISFEDNRYSKPIILGKLFVDADSSTPAFNLPQVLDVQEKAVLPVNTTIGEYKVHDILKSIASLEYFKNVDFTPSTAPAQGSVPGDVLYFGSGIGVEPHQAITDPSISFDVLKNYSLVFMRCYFNDEWAGCSFGVWFTPQTFTINPNDKFNAPIIMVGDDNKYLRHYGMKFTCDGTNWFALIGADNNTISRFNIVEVVGVLRV